jgi:predicted CXXCH cytochrome family protein
MMSSRLIKLAPFAVLGILALMVISAASVNPQPVLAQENSTPTQTVVETPTPAPETQMTSEGGHADCLGCHSNPNMVGKFTNGETVSLYYDETAHGESVHAGRGLGCRACHAEQGNYPHPMSSENSCSNCHFQLTGDTSLDAQLVFDIPLENARAMSLQLNQACSRCHQDEGKEVMDGDHERILESGNPYAPVCIDCHGSHDVKPVSETNVPQVCAKCHTAVYTAYKSSVHGSALENEGNTDVPTCANCHGIHVVKGPDDANFRADSIELCGGCHGDQELMAKYGISTEVFNTYLDDFHGRSVEFSRMSKMNVDKATCYDCHGVHNILPPQDEASTVYPANLQRTCQRCHADADVTFPEAWLSHKVPVWTNAPFLYAVNVAYIILIPAILGGMILYIALDAYHRISTRKKNDER